MKKIIIKIPSNHYFYINLSLQIKKAFNKKFIDVFIEYPLPDQTRESLYSYIKPNLVFSINGVRPKELCKTIPHYSWIQDDIFMEIDFKKVEFDNGRNDHIFVLNNRLKNFLFGEKSNVDILKFATEPSENLTEYIGEGGAKLAFISYIPDSGLYNKVYSFDDKKFSGWDFYNYLSVEIKKNIDFPRENMDLFIKNFFNSLDLPDVAIPLDFYEDYMRGFYRSIVFNSAVRATNDLKIYGPLNWLSWSKASNYYAGELNSYGDYQAVLKKSLFNIHNGGTISHPRVYDCFGANGGILLANRRSILEGDADFIPNTHFIEYDYSNKDALSEILESYIGHPNLEHMRRNAYELIMDRHTWDHRVDQIIKKFNI